MGLANCRFCGDLFHTFSGRLECPTCLALEHEQLETVRQYVRGSEERSVGVIASETGIESSQILKWLRGKRLALDVVPGELRCYRCDAGIRSGRFCESCQRELAEDIAAQRDLRNGEDVPKDEAEIPRGFVLGQRERGPSPEFVSRKAAEQVAKPASGMHLRG